MGPKCTHCGRVFARNHCPRCYGCKATESHRGHCPRDPNNQPAGKAMP
jgi:hypothetical protein